MVKEHLPLSPISARSLGGSSTINTPPSPPAETAIVAPQPQQQLSSKPSTTTNDNNTNNNNNNNNNNMTAAATNKNSNDATATVAPDNTNSTPVNANNVNNHTTTTTTTSSSSSSSKNQSSPPPQPQIEYNPRWKGYMYILLSSLINFASICNIPRNHEHYNNMDDIDFFNNTQLNVQSSFDIVNGTRGVALSFSIVTFVYSALIILMDRLQICSTKFHYMKSYNGCIVEGISLCVGTLYSIIAVAYITQVQGIAYLTLNIYFSVWLILISFIYTLNKWSTAKDILSIAELTGISTTLKSWYMIFISSMVVTGTSMNVLVVLSTYESTRFEENENARAATLGIVFGFCSTIISFWMILSHYNFIECTNEGGWFELLLIIVIILIWIIATAVMTTNNSIAATITGSGCYVYEPVTISPTSAPSMSLSPTSDVITGNSTTLQNMLNLIQEAKRLANQTNETFGCFLSMQNITYSCDLFVIDDDSDVISNNTGSSNGNSDSTTNGKGNITDVDISNLNSLEAIPGSNLYIFLWINLLTSFHLVSRWKAQQALQFAQTQQQQQLKATGTPQLTATTKNNTSNAYHGEDVESDVIEQDNGNDGSDADIDDFDDDDRY